MKQYLIDELRPAEHENLKKALDDKYGEPVFDGLYWIPLDPALYNNIQAEHVDCQPYYFALNLEPNSLACELLVRTQNRVRCNCISYASEGQRNWLIRLVDDLFDELEIKT